jgi:hypothetical protein
MLEFCLLFFQSPHVWIISISLHVLDQLIESNSPWPLKS